MAIAISLSLLLLIAFVTNSALAWIHFSTPKNHQRSVVCRSTPFEAEFYRNDDDDNPFEDDRVIVSKLEVEDKSTRLVFGINKYSHDTALCAANADTGEVLWALSKERQTRKKHDAGNIASLTERCLQDLDLDLDNVVKVVYNNHHHRVFPIEQNLRHIEWECGLQINQGAATDGYDDPENLFPNVEDKHELSHHLAHAYSTATQAPFDHGMVVVMDGMGETFRNMYRAHILNDTIYTSDFDFGMDTFQCVPSDLIQQSQISYFDWREAESIYTFQKTDTSIDITPVFKRFTAENSPPSLYNHGFENMDSVGALYSRASSHIFGDWNACGKVMGLAPWAQHKWMDNNSIDGSTKKPVLHTEPIMSGNLYVDNGLAINRALLEGMPHIARQDADMYDQDGTRKKRYDFDDNTEKEQIRQPLKVALDAIALAYRIQIDLETVVIDCVKHFKEKTQAQNLCLAGGVALNSVLNGKLARELGFKQTFVSPYPGDDGIAVGCCAFGLYGNALLNENAKSISTTVQPPIWTTHISPYLGPDYSEQDVDDAVEQAQPWIVVERIRNDEQRLDEMAKEVQSGGIIAWYRSRSELGPRALGHRSIIADPRRKGLVRFINESVKKRESFRPFAPSVLAEEARDWFDLGDSATTDANVSPFMSMTAFVHPDKRSEIPAVTHVDGSSRMQTVTETDEPLYHAFIKKFFKLTGIPMVLNTSFNTLPGEPIVETPSDAVRSFLCSMGSIEMLVLDEYIIRRKKANLRKLLGEVNKQGDLKTIPATIHRSGVMSLEAKVQVPNGKVNADEPPETVTRISMPNRPMHSNKHEWYELIDDLEGEVLSVLDGTVTLNDIIAEYTANPEGLKAEDIEDTEGLVQNIVDRLVRLYENTLIYW